MHVKPEDLVVTLRAMREHHGLTQEELAERIRVHRMTISKLETGEHRLTVDNMTDIVHALGYEVAIVIWSR